MATLIRVDQAYEIPDQLPVVALRDLVFFPYMVLPLLIGRPPSLAALEVAEKGDGYILLLAQKDVQVEEPSTDDVHRVGVVAQVLQVSRLPDGNARVVLEGIGRCRVRRFLKSEESFTASIEPFVAEERAEGREPSEGEAVARGVLRLFHEYVHLCDRVPGRCGDLDLSGERPASLGPSHLRTSVWCFRARSRSFSNPPLSRRITGS